MYGNGAVRNYGVEPVTVGNEAFFAKGKVDEVVPVDPFAVRVRRCVVQDRIADFGWTWVFFVQRELIRVLAGER